MKNQHKQKGYRLDTKITRKNYQHFAKIQFPEIFELRSKNSNTPQNNEFQTLNTQKQNESLFDNIEYQPKLADYLFQSYATDNRLFSSLKKVSDYLVDKNMKELKIIKKEGEKIKKHHSQGTEVQSPIS